MSGCASQLKQSTPLTLSAKVDRALLQECSALPLPRSELAQHYLDNNITIIKMYAECKAKHDALANVVRAIEKEFSAR
jgi:hypothetical protein